MRRPGERAYAVTAYFMPYLVGPQVASQQSGQLAANEQGSHDYHSV
jgi:hypothetical protein